MSLPAPPSVHSLLAFMEFLHINSISYKVILNYMSSLKIAGKKFGWNLAPFDHHLVSSYIRSISIKSNFSHTPRDIFDLNTPAAISKACEILHDLPLFRAAFLLAFFALLRMFNIAPHSRFKFDRNKHILRQDIIFLPPGAHILLKWTKTLQDSSAHHFVQIPALKNPTLCPVRAIKKLLRSRDLSRSAPLFAHNSPPFYPVIDTTITWFPYLQAFWSYSGL